MTGEAPRVAQGTDQHHRETGSEPPSHWRRLVQGYGLLFQALGVVLLYEYLFLLTKPSPVTGRELDSARLTVALLLVTTVLVAGSVATLAWGLLQAIPGGVHGKKWDEIALMVLGGAVVSIGALAFLENSSYSAWGVGLRAEQGTVAKVPYLVFALSTGALLARRWLGSPRANARAARLSVFACLPAGLIIGYSVMGSPPLPHLEKDSDEQTEYNVVILSSDAVEADHMSVYGYARDTTPFLRKHASEFQIHANAFANNGRTPGSVASMLTGMDPLRIGVISYPDALNAEDSRRTLPALLRTAGFSTSNWSVPTHVDAHNQNLRAFQDNNGRLLGGRVTDALPLGDSPARWFTLESVSELHSITLDAMGVAESFGAGVWLDTPDFDDADRLAGVIESIGRPEPVFVNAHFMGTHGPRYAVDSPLFSDGQDQDSDWATDFYDDAIRRFDEQVASVYRQLKSSGELDRTILVVTSDHGRRWDPTVRVPVMIRYPNAQPNGWNSRIVQRLDLAPTIIATLGYTPPDWMQGVSLLHPEALEPRREILATGLADPAGDYAGFHATPELLVQYRIRCQGVRGAHPSRNTGSRPTSAAATACESRASHDATVDTPISAKPGRTGF